MNDRDTFASAALTGLINTHAVYHKEPPALAVMAYAAADAMLRERSRAVQEMAESAIPRAVCQERERTNHGAEPAATAPSSGNDGQSPDSHGTGNRPAPPCVETDGFSPGSRTGLINQTPERESPRRECGESSLRDVPQPDNGRAAGGPEHFSYLKNDEERGDSHTKMDTTPPRNGALADGSVGVSQTAIAPVAWAMVEADGRIEATFTDKDEAAEWCDESQRIVPLYRQPQASVVRLPPLDPNGTPGWNAAIGAVREALADAGVDWDTE